MDGPLEGLSYGAQFFEKIPVVLFNRFGRMFFLRRLFEKRLVFGYVFTACAVDIRLGPECSEAFRV
jgi:hypothetical protein